MLPEVQKYIDTVDRARERYHKRCDELGYRDWDARNRAMINRNRTRERAWNELKKSDNKLVAWIASNDEIANNYREHGIAILKVLPGTVEEIDRVARENQWCPVWDMFRQEAINAGVTNIALDIEVKVNGYPWGPYRHLYMADGSPITQEELNNFFNRGANLIQIDNGSEILRFQRKEREVQTPSNPVKQ